MTSSKAPHVFTAVALALLMLPAGAYAQATPPADAPVRAEEAPQELALSEDLLSRYVGVYQLAPNATMAVTLENSSLFTQLTGQPKFELFPESETRFVLKAVEAAIEFEHGPSGIPAAVLHQNGRSLRAPRV